MKNDHLRQILLLNFAVLCISTVSIMSSIQPIFGIILAIFFLQKVPNWRSMIGGGLILLTVRIESSRAVRK